MCCHIESPETKRAARLRPRQRITDLPHVRLLYPVDEGECEEPDPVGQSLARGELPPEVIAFAERYAGWAYRRGWGDRDDLFSAALRGAWKAAEVASTKPGFSPVSWRAWVGYFVRNRMWTHWRNEMATAAVRRRLGSAVYTGRGGDVGGVVRDTKTPAPSHRAEREEFWRRASHGLTDKQAKALRLVHRDGLGLTEAGRKLGIAAKNVEDSLGWATSKLVANLRVYRKTMPFPDGRRKKSAESADADPHRLDAETFRRCLAVLPPGLSARARNATDLRAVLGAIRYRWTVGGPWNRMPERLAGKAITQKYVGKWGEDGTLEKLRPILALTGGLDANPRGYGRSYARPR